MSCTYIPVCPLSDRNHWHTLRRLMLHWKNAAFGQKDRLLVFTADMVFICEVFVTDIAYSL